MASPGAAPSPSSQFGPGFSAQAPRYSGPPFSGPPRPGMYTARLPPPPRTMGIPSIGGIQALPPPLTNKIEPPKPTFLGGTGEKPYTTVYVGKISPTVDDTFLRNVLGICGEVKNWKRAQDPTINANKAFGFCEFEHAEGVLRALRLLNNYNLEGSAIMIKIDPDTQEYLERYIAAKENQYYLENAALEDDVETAPGVEIQPRNPVKDPEAFGIVSDRDKQADRSALDRLKQLLEDRARNKPFIRPRSPARVRDGDHDDDGRHRERDRERDRERARREKDRKDRLRESERAYEELLREWEARERDKERVRIQEIERERERRRDRKRLVKMQEEESDDDDWKKRRYRATSHEERRRKRQREREEDISDVMREQQEIIEAKRRRIEDAQRAIEKEMSAERERAEQLAEKSAELQRVADQPDANMEEVPSSDDHLTSNADTPDNGACDIDNNVKEAFKHEPPKPTKFSLPNKKGAQVPLYKPEDEEEAPTDQKVRPRVPEPIDYSAEEIQAVAASKTNSQKIQMKQLIDAIPTSKEELFSYEVDWSIFDKHKLDQKMKPWIAKKITEFLGEEENTFIEYILQHTRKHVSAASMLKLLETILDNEAELFVLKMWKMLIFEIRRIQTGLAG